MRMGCGLSSGTRLEEQYKKNQKGIALWNPICAPCIRAKCAPYNADYANPDFLVQILTAYMVSNRKAEMGDDLRCE
jgi:hypothetical protein